MMRPPELDGRLLTMTVIVSCAALAAVIGLRILGPSDMHHQTQPKTIAYTTDIIVNGRWMLPIERGELPATKPPLYNWLAVPFVSAGGFASELAHKAPSVLGLIATWLLAVVVGECVLRVRGLGFLSAAMLVAGYTIFKLGYLARPDMLVVLWLAVAWVLGTAILVRRRPGVNHSRSDGWLAAGFWTAVGLAWMTKGPVGLLPIVYAVLGAKLVAGDWRAFHAFRWWWGVPVSLLPFGAWVWRIYEINPDFVIGTLWEDELAGRIVGTGAEAPDEGPAALLTGLLDMPAYFMLRFAPWSFLAVFAMIDIWRRDRGAGVARWRAAEGALGPWLHGAGVWAILVIAAFTLSAGKRADYIAPAYPAAALLAGWWWQGTLRRSRLLYGAGLATACLVVAILAVVEFREPQSPRPGHGDAIDRFIQRLRQRIESEPLPLRFIHLGDTHIQAYLGSSIPQGNESVREALARYDRIWVVAGERPQEAREFPELPLVRDEKLKATPVLRAEGIERTDFWPGEVTLYLLEHTERD